MVGGSHVQQLGVTIGTVFRPKIMMLNGDIQVEVTTIKYRRSFSRSSENSGDLIMRCMCIIELAINSST